MNTHGATVNRGEIVSMYAGLYKLANSIQKMECSLSFSTPYTPPENVENYVGPFNLVHRAIILFSPVDSASIRLILRYIHYKFLRIL